MDPCLAGVARDQHGFFYRWQALEAGYTRGEIARLLRIGEWRLVRYGAYADRATYDALDDVGRYLLRVRAVVAGLQGEVVVTHASAGAVLDVPIWGVDLSKVHVHRDGGRSGRREAGVVHHVGALPESQIREVGGLLVAAPERTLVDSAREASFEAGVVIADGLKRLHPCDDDEVLRILASQRDWAGAATASRVVEFSDGRAETVGESRSRVQFARVGLPKPDLQVVVELPDGSLVRSDFGFLEENTLGEFDGKIKYGRMLYERGRKPSEADFAEVVWLEKRREDGLRELGHEIGRLIWDDLGRDEVVRQRFLRAFGRARRRRVWV